MFVLYTYMTLSIGVAFWGSIWAFLSPFQHQMLYNSSGLIGIFWYFDAHYTFQEEPIRALVFDTRCWNEYQNAYVQSGKGVITFSSGTLKEDCFSCSRCSWRPPTRVYGSIRIFNDISQFNFHTHLIVSKYYINYIYFRAL